MTMDTATERTGPIGTLILITPEQYDLLMAPWRTVIGDRA